MENVVWYWLAAVVIFLIMELMTPTLVFICFVAGSLLAGVYSFFVPDGYYTQIGIFIIVSLLLLPLMRKIAKKITKPSPQKSNIDALIGKIGLVTKKIDLNLGGQIRFEGEVWIASADEDIDINEKVEIVSSSGTKLHVIKKI